MGAPVISGATGVVIHRHHGSDWLSQMQRQTQAPPDIRIAGHNVSIASTVSRTLATGSQGVSCLRGRLRFSAPVSSQGLGSRLAGREIDTEQASSASSTGRQLRAGREINVIERKRERNRAKAWIGSITWGKRLKSGGVKTALYCGRLKSSDRCAVVCRRTIGQENVGWGGYRVGIDVSSHFFGGECLQSERGFFEIQGRGRGRSRVRVRVHGNGNGDGDNGEQGVSHWCRRHWQEEEDGKRGHALRALSRAEYSELATSLPTSKGRLSDVFANCRAASAERQRYIITDEAQSKNLADSRAGDPVLIIPGFLADANDFVPLATYLRSRGFNALVVPISWYNWLPSLGGRSVRPILDRIEATISYALNVSATERLSTDQSLETSEGRVTDGLSKNAPESDGQRMQQNDGRVKKQSSESGELVASGALPKYTFADFIAELRNPKLGSQVLLRQALSSGSESEPDSRSGNGAASEAVESSREKSSANDQEESQCDGRRVALVAHSASGWIARILMGSGLPYDGRSYGLAKRVQVLLTLGTPHFCTDKLTKRNLEFVNSNYPGTAEEAQGVQYVCVAGKAKIGETRFGGLLQNIAYQSYVLCCGRGDVWGDGITPVECALGLAGAKHLVLDDIQHSPTAERKGGKWYGSPGVVEQWLPCLSVFQTDKLL